MNHWLETSKKNLVPLSSADNFDDAQKEWKFTGNVIPGDGQELVCELCEHPDLSSHFEIKNEQNLNLLLVGSSCIKRFHGIQVFDELGVLATTEEGRDQVLQRALRARLTENSLTPLRALWSADRENRARIGRLGKMVKAEEAVSPSDLAFLFERMDALEVPYNPSQYKVSLRADMDKHELESMRGDRLAKVWQALSVPQMKKYAHLRGRF